MWQGKLRINRNGKMLLSILFIFFVLFCPPLWAASIYVSPNGTGTGSILSPMNLQHALNIARKNGQNDIIYLQKGTYDASVNTFTYSSTNNDNKAVTLKGGWNKSFTSQSTNRTLTELDGDGTNRVLEIIGNMPGVNITFTLENLTIQNGYVTSIGGAGIRAYSIDTATINLTIRNCLIKDNVASGTNAGGMYTNCYFEVYDSTFSSNSAYSGGAMMISYTTSLGPSLAPIIDNCTFEDNNNIDGWQGNTIFNYASPIITNSTFKGRSDGVSISGNGATIENYTNSSPTIYECTFIGNIVNYWGAAVDFWDAGGYISNCLFINNQAGKSGTGAGAAISIYDPSLASPKTVTVTNCTFAGNRTLGGELYGGAIYNRTEMLNVINCIFWDNGTYGLYNDLGDSGSVTASYSYVAGGFSGTGITDGGNNINVITYPNPLFVDPANNDYHLQATSPCVDTGNNGAFADFATDFEGDYRILDGNNDGDAIVDIGADEYSLPVTVMTLFTPNGAEIIPSGSIYNIIWAAPPEAESFKLLYSLNNGLTWNLIVSETTDKAYRWEVPKTTGNKKGCLVKVIGYDASGVKIGAATSDATFTIEVVRLTSPDGYEIMTSGGEHLITWDIYDTNEPVTQVQLFYTKDGGTTWLPIKTLSGSYPSGSYSYLWKPVPSVGANPKTKCKVKVVLKDAKGVTRGSDVSDNFFTINP